MGVGFAGGDDDFLAGGADFSVGDVFGDGGVEEEDVLADEGEVQAEVGEAGEVDGEIVDEDLAGGGIVEAEEEVEEGAFAGAAFAGEAEAAAAGEGEVDVVEDEAVAVGEADVPELERAGEAGEGDGMGGFPDGGLELEEGHEALEGDGELRDVDADAAHFLEGGVEEDEGEDEGEDLGVGAVGPDGVENDGAEAEGVEGLDDGVEHLAALDALHVEVGGALGGLEEEAGVDFLEGVGLGDADVLEGLDGDAALADIGAKS